MLVQLERQNEQSERWTGSGETTADLSGPTYADLFAKRSFCTKFRQGPELPYLNAARFPAPIERARAGPEPVHLGFRPALCAPARSRRCPSFTSCRSKACQLACPPKSMARRAEVTSRAHESGEAALNVPRVSCPSSCPNGASDLAEQREGSSLATTDHSLIRSERWRESRRED